MTTKAELVQRWDGFLKKIENRFNESLQHAEEASIALLQESGYDYNQTMQAFAGMRGQIQHLIRKIDDTWTNQVRPEMEAVFESTGWVDEGQKAGELSGRLWDKLRHFETVLEGTLSKKYYDYAIQIIDKDFNCTQCNAKLQVIKTIFRSQYITCDYCDTVNTFEPATQYAHLGWGIVDNMVKKQLLDEKIALDDSYNTIKAQAQFSQDAEQDWIDYKNQYIAYYKKYFTERIQLNSELQNSFEDDMQRKLKEFEDFKNSR